MKKKLYRFRKPADRNCYQVMFSYKPGKWMSTGTDDYAEAVLFAEEQMKADLYGSSTQENPTFSKFATGIFDESDPHGIRKRDEMYNRSYSADYYKTKNGYLNLYIMPRFGAFTLSAITAPAIEQWFLNMTLVGERKKGQRMADGTRNKILATLRLILEVAVWEGYLTDNVAKKVDPVLVKSKTRETFNKEEMAKLFPEDDILLSNVWGDLSYCTYFLIERDTGWRPGEIAALSIDNYYPDLHGIYSKDSASHGKLKQSIKTTGKGKDYKVGILSAQTEHFLSLLIKQCKAKNEQYLFKRNGRFLDVTTSENYFRRRASAVIDLRDRTQYCLRHSFETDIAGTVENKILAELMAHTAYNPTYDHRSPERILEQLQPFREILEKRKGGD